MSDQYSIKSKLRSGLQLRLTSVAILCAVIMAGCQPVGSTPAPTPTTLISPTKTAAATFSVSTLPGAVSSPESSPQIPTSTPENSKTNLTPIVLLGTIIDGSGAAPLEDAALVIHNGRITDVGKRQELEIPDGAKIYDLQGATILPGFINAHVHTTYDPVLLEMWAQAGVTTVRDLGARYPFLHFPTRDQLNKDPNLATIIAAGPLVTVAGGYPIAGINFPSLVVTNPDHARREIDQLIAEGADVIKIVVESGGGHPTLSLEAASAIVETAHQWKVPVSAHIGTLQDLKLALEAGIDDFSHILHERIPKNILEQLVEKNVYWTPTLEATGGHGVGDILRFINAGGQIALGNDSGMLPGVEIGMPMREIEMLQAAGMSAMEIIVAATRNAAHVCNREGTLGTLEKGKIADILVVYGDPLANLQALMDVLLVIHQGVVIRDSTQE